MALFYKCGYNKMLAGIPTIFNLTLVIYISVVFLTKFLPDLYPEYTFMRLCLEIPFLWFSSMTIFLVFRITTSDPGYLSP